MANKKHAYHKVRAEVIAERGIGWQTPVKIVEGDQPPRKEGEQGGFDKPVYYLDNGVRKLRFVRVTRPCKGARRYHRSTIYITVGMDWCKENAPEAIAFFAAKRLGVKK